MSRRLIWTDDAELDLIEIWLYISSDNEEAATALVRQIRAKCEALVEFPNSGVRRRDIHNALRSSTIGNYVIFYQPLDDGILVVRILHGAQDIDLSFHIQ